MSAGTVVAGVITFLLGLAGLAEIFGRPVLPFSLAVVSFYITPLGALLLFAVIAILGLGLIIGGIVEGDRKVVVAEPVAAQPVVVAAPGTVPAPVGYALTDLDITILRYLSQGKDAHYVSKVTHVDRPTISEKIARLQAYGYVTSRHTLTEKGYEVLRRVDTAQPVYERPA
jgi:hypothetical protein